MSVAKLGSSFRESSTASLTEVANLLLFGESKAGYCAFCGAETELSSQVCILHQAQVTINHS